MPLRAFILWSRVLRVLLSAALLALLPLAEVAHAMPDNSAPNRSAPNSSAPDHAAMPMAGMAMPADHSPHGDSDACRIMCLGWVQATSVTRPTAPVSLLIGSVPTPPVTLSTGLGPSPRGRPPKTLLHA